MLTINPEIQLDESEIQEVFARASGPGGQNVNKVSTAVELRFDVKNSPSLPEEVKARLARLAGSRLTAEGVLVIRARHYRSQERNRQEARRRLVALLERAAHTPHPRRPTRPSAASQRRRLETKRQRGETKHLRRRVEADEG